MTVHLAERLASETGTALLVYSLPSYWPLNASKVETLRRLTLNTPRFTGIIQCTKIPSLQYAMFSIEHTNISLTVRQLFDRPPTRAWLSINDLCENDQRYSRQKVAYDVVLLIFNLTGSPGYYTLVCTVITFSRLEINRVWLPILFAVS